MPNPSAEILPLPLLVHGIASRATRPLTRMQLKVTPQPSVSLDRQSNQACTVSERAGAVDIKNNRLI